MNPRHIIRSELKVNEMTHPYCMRQPYLKDILFSKRAFLAPFANIYNESSKDHSPIIS